MKEYVQALIRSQGEQAAGKIVKDMSRFIEYLFNTDAFSSYREWKGLETELWFEFFQDEVLNK